MKKIFSQRQSIAALSKCRSLAKGDEKSISGSALPTPGCHSRHWSSLGVPVPDSLSSLGCPHPMDPGLSQTELWRILHKHLRISPQPEQLWTALLLLALLPCLPPALLAFSQVKFTFRQKLHPLCSASGKLFTTRKTNVCCSDLMSSGVKLSVHR